MIGVAVSGQRTAAGAAASAGEAGVQRIAQRAIVALDVAAKPGPIAYPGGGG
jgi:hypothetical protein